MVSVIPFSGSSAGTLLYDSFFSKKFFLILFPSHLFFLRRRSFSTSPESICEILSSPRANRLLFSCYDSCGKRFFYFVLFPSTSRSFRLPPTGGPPLVPFPLQAIVPFLSRFPKPPRSCVRFLSLSKISFFFLLS